MATLTEQLQAFTQSVYLVIKGKYFDDIAGTDGTTLINQTIDWCNMFIDELKMELNSSGDPINWDFTRQNGVTLGTATQGNASISWDDTEFSNLIAEEGRYVQILQDTTVISNWAVVDPGQITNQKDRVTEDMCALVGNVIVFSRVFKDTEDGGTIIGDITVPIPRMSTNNIDVLTGDNAIKPKTLLILGVAKNASLPDIVQGGLSPSYTQKYGDLLKSAIARTEASSRADKVASDDYGAVRGVY